MVLRAGAGRGGGGEAKEQEGERRRARGGGRRCGSRRGKGWLRASLPPQLRPGPGLQLRVRRRRRRRRRRTTTRRRRRRKAGLGCRGRRSLRYEGRALDARGEARRGLRRAGGAGRRDSARGGGALSRAAPLGPLPLLSSVGACALRAPQPLMSCAARGAAGLGGIRCPPKAYTRAGENCLALPLSGSEPDRLSLPLYVPSPLYLALL